MLPDNALEQHQGTVAAGADPLGDCGRVERLLLKHHDAAPLADCTPAHGRNHSQLVTVLEWVIPSGVLGVDSAPEGPRQRTQIVSRAELTPGVGGGGPGRQRQIDIRLADQLPRLGEEHDSHLHGVMISPLL